MLITSRRRYRWTLSAAFFIVTSLIILQYSFPKPYRQISSIKALAYNDPDFPFDEFGFLEFGISEALCRSHGWFPFPPALRGSRRKVYDLFAVNEINWLNIRLNELDQEVDYFLIVESSKTFDNRDKPLHVKENWESLKRFHHKIIYLELNSTNSPDLNTWVTWDRKKSQRNAIYDRVFPYLVGDEKPRMGDIILVSDSADALPRPSTLKLLRNCNFPRRLTLRSRMYSYSFQWLHPGREYNHPQATTYLGAATIKPNDLLGDVYSFSSWWWWEYQNLENAAWYCSNCFPTVQETVAEIKTNGLDEFRNLSEIVEMVRTGKGLWDRPDDRYLRIERNEDIPEYLRLNQAKYKYMLDRDPANGNYMDFNPK